MNTPKTKKRPKRMCRQCGDTIPETRSSRALYCNSNCGRVATYQRKSLEERREINRRSNKRRSERDLLPRVRSIVELSKMITPGTPLSQYVAACVIAHAVNDWRWAHALNFNAASGALERMCGDPELLEIFQEGVIT